MSDFGVRWDAGLEPPDPCENAIHDVIGECAGCGLQFALREKYDAACWRCGETERVERSETCPDCEDEP